jgi:hypothetical protein
LLAKPTPRNVNLGSDRFAMFNKERDIPYQGTQLNIRAHPAPQFTCTNCTGAGVADLAGAELAPEIWTGR